MRWVSTTRSTPASICSAALYAATTEVGNEFDEIKAKDGLKAALAWRKA
jgi:hypothetical protein